jgi:hypothetical protein
MAGDSRTLKLSILADVDDLNKKLKAATGDVEGFGGKMANVGKKIGVALAAAAAAAGAMAIKIGVDAVKAASDLSETQSKVGVIFGESADAINKFAATAATRLGQSKQQALDAAATFATFGKSAGLAGDDLVGFSTELSVLSADLASFYNTSPEQAIGAIGAALRGESEPIRAYGVLLNDATLKQEAMSMGIYNGTGALSAQQKVLAAQAVIMKQTSDAQGDFERTSGGLANQQRILAAQFENIKSTIGTALLPVVLELVSAFNRNVLPAIVAVGDAIGAGGLNKYIQNLRDFIKNFFLPILEGLKAGWDSILQAVNRNSESFQKLANFIKDVVAPVVGTTLKYALEIVGNVFGRIIDIIGAAIDKISAFVEAIKNMVNAVISAYNRLPTPDIGLIGAGGRATGGAGSTAGGGAFGGSSSSGGMAGGSGSGSGAGTFGGGSAGGGAGGSAGGGAGGSAPLGATSMLKLVDRLTDISDKFTDLQFLVDTGGISRTAGVAELNKLTKEFDVLSAQADRLVANQTLAAQPPYMPNFNVSFNGIVGDPEGVKRQLVELMNDSTARGTLGAGAFDR